MGSLCVPLQTLDVHVSETMEASQSEPYLVVMGQAGKERTQYFISAEGALNTESSSFRDALLDLMCYYYVFNISYPTSLSGVFLFIQHFVCNLKDSQKYPNSLTKLLKNIH